LSFLRRFFFVSRCGVDIATSVLLQPTLRMFIYLQKCHCIFDNVVFGFNRLHMLTLNIVFLLVNFLQRSSKLRIVSIWWSMPQRH